MAHIGEEI